MSFISVRKRGKNGILDVEHAWQVCAQKADLGEFEP
jgi:hypothetical protein